MANTLVFIEFVIFREVQARVLRTTWVQLLAYRGAAYWGRIRLLSRQYRQTAWKHCQPVRTWRSLFVPDGQLRFNLFDWLIDWLMWPDRVCSFCSLQSLNAFFIKYYFRFYTLTSYRNAWSHNWVTNICSVESNRLPFAKVNVMLDL